MVEKTLGVWGIGTGKEMGKREGLQQETREFWGVDIYIHDLDYGYGLQLYTYVITSEIVHLTYVQFIIV